jgi:hypothetical protein
LNIRQQTFPHQAKHGGNAKNGNHQWTHDTERRNASGLDRNEFVVPHQYRDRYHRRHETQNGTEQQDNRNRPEKVIQKNNFGNIVCRPARLNQRIEIRKEVKNHENSDETEIPTDKVEQKTPQNVPIQNGHTEWYRKWRFHSRGKNQMTFFEGWTL